MIADVDTNINPLTLQPGAPAVLIGVNEQTWSAPYFGKVFSFSFGGLLVGLGPEICVFTDDNTKAKCVRSDIQDQSFTEIKVQRVNRKTCQVTEFTKEFRVPFQNEP